MKLNLTTFGLAILLLSSSSAFPQSTAGKLGFGIQGGVQRLYGDQTKVSFGPGVDGFISFRFLKFADLALGFGYSQLKAAGGTNDLVTADLKTNLELMSKGIFRPLFSLGAGIVSYESGTGRKLSPAIFGGVGFRFKLSPKFDWLLGTDYRYTTTDQLDGPPPAGSKSKDGYLNIRTGIVFHPKGEESERPRIIADQRVPFFEIDDEPDAYQPFQDESFNNPSGNTFPAQQETKDMEEYVRLKSRVDALVQNVDSKEKEILQLQNSLNNGKRRLTSLESRVSRLPSKKVPRSSSMSGFSEIYESALTNYYNKNYTESISLLKLLLQQYPSHSLASNCQFWIAQSMFRMNNFRESIDEFYKVLAYERSLKRDDSIYLLGQAYLKIGSGDRAKEAFTRLIREYPDSEFIQSAQDYLRKL